MCVDFDARNWFSHNENDVWLMFGFCRHCLNFDAWKRLSPYENGIWLLIEPLPATTGFRQLQVIFAKWKCRWQWICQFHTVHWLDVRILIVDDDNHYPQSKKQHTQFSHQKTVVLDTAYLDAANTRPHHQFQTYSKTKSLCCNITFLFDIHPHPFCQRPLVLQHYTTRTEPNRTAMSHEPNRTEPPCHANRNEPACWWTEPPLFEVSTNRNEPKRTEAFLYYAYACMFLIFWVCLYVSGVLKNWNIGSMTWCHQPSAGIPYDSNPLIHAGPVHKVSISQIPSVTHSTKLWKW